MSDESQEEKPKRLPQWVHDEIFKDLTDPIEAERKKRGEDQLARGRALEAESEVEVFSTLPLPKWYCTDRNRELDEDSTSLRACYFFLSLFALTFGLGTMGFSLGFIPLFLASPLAWVPLIGKRVPQGSKLNRGFWWLWGIVFFFVFLSI